MLTLNWFIGILLQILIGIGAGFYFVKLIKRPVLGHVWGGIIVGVIGSVVIGFFLNTFGIFKWLEANNPFSVDFLANGFGAFLLIWIFSKLTHH